MNAKFVEGNVAWFLSFGVLLYQWVLLRVNFFRSPFLIHHLLPAYTVGKFPYNRRKREKKNCMCPILIGNSVVMMIITTSKYGGSRFQYTDNLKGGVDYLYHYQALHITNHSHPSAIQSRAPICLSVVPPLGMSAWLLYVLSSPPPPAQSIFVHRLPSKGSSMEHLVDVSGLSSACCKVQSPGRQSHQVVVNGCKNRNQTRLGGCAH